jgi:hypothetical protein
MVTECLLPKSELIFICCWCLSLHRMGLLPDLTLDNAAGLRWSYVIGALLYPLSTGKGGGYTVLPLPVRSSQDVHNIFLSNYLWQQSDILVSPLKMIFSLTGYVHEHFSFIIKLIKKKTFFVITPNKIYLYWFSLIRLQSEIVNFIKIWNEKWMYV